MRRFLLVCVVTLLVLGVGGSVSYWVYSSQRDKLLDEAADQIDDATAAFTYAVNSIFEPILATSETVQNAGIWNAAFEDRRRLFFALATGMVGHYQQINGLFIGFPDGRFLHVQDLRISGEGATTNESAGVRLIGRTIDRPESDRVGTWQVYDRGAGTWKPFEGSTGPYDPRLRPWYRSAVERKASLWTEPYVFASSGKLGVTYADPIYDNAGTLLGVVGVDLSLDTLSQTLLSTSNILVRIADYVFATDLNRKIVGHPDFIRYRAQLDQNVKAFLARYNASDSFERILAEQLTESDKVEIVTVDGVKYMAARSDLDPRETMALRIYVARDLRKVLANATAVMQRNGILVFAGIVFFGIIASYAVKLRVEMAARRRAETELIEARDIAEQATQAKSDFLAAMSHEIRGPMNGVMSMGEMLGLTRLDGEQRWMTKIINDSANALLTIINDILDFSKIEAGKLEIEQVAFSLTDSVNGTAEFLATNAEEKGLDVIVDIDPTLADHRLGDPTRLKQILLNLGSNAVKFTEQGSIRIDVMRGAGKFGDWVRFEVSDTGIGLTDEQKSRLFLPFVQADASTTRKYGGTGLGLSICQRLVELINGRIGVRSTFGEGSTFWFELPLKAIDDDVLRPEPDIAGASVRLIGLPDAVAAVTERYLRAAGIAAVGRSEDLGDTRDMTADLWIVSCTVSGLTAAALSALDGMIVLCGRRTDISGIPAAVKAAASRILPFPLSAPVLWRAAAASLGHDVPDDPEGDLREDLAFSPPDPEAARAANVLILVAEDNDINQTVILHLLSKMGFACEIARDGKAALAMLERPGYGLLLADISMPEMDGYQLARTVREGERANGGHMVRLPIVALTADALAGTEEACLEAGMDDYLTKPIDSRRFSRIIEKYLPDALALRKPARSESSDRETEPAVLPYESPDWDPDIFDIRTLGGPSGSLDRETKELIRKATDAWVGNIEHVNAAFARKDKADARDAVHFLKSASLSIGATRLSRIASDMQEFLDAGDFDTAAMMAEVLQPTLDEFRELLPRILRE